VDSSAYEWLAPWFDRPSPKGVSPKPSLKTVLHSLGCRHEIDKRRFLWDLRVALAWTASIWAPAAKHHGLNLSRLQHLQSRRRQFFNLLDRSSSSIPGSKFPVRQIHDSPVDLSRCPTNHACTLSLIPGRSSSRAKHPPYWCFVPPSSHTLRHLTCLPVTRAGLSRPGNMLVVAWTSLVSPLLLV
jgi:hypothetical protein